jgi:hypothetical protein
MPVDTLTLVLLGVVLLVVASMIRRRSLRRASREAVHDGMARGPSRVIEDPSAPGAPEETPTERPADR